MAAVAARERPEPVVRPAVRGRGPAGPRKPVPARDKDSHKLRDKHLSDPKAQDPVLHKEAARAAAE